MPFPVVRKVVRSLCKARTIGPLLTALNSRPRYARIAGLHHFQVRATVHRHHATNLAVNEKPDWDKVISEAENVVGYPSTSLSLCWSGNDMGKITEYLRKLSGSKHPLLKTAKSLLHNERNDMPKWGLIVWLISKAGGHLNVDEMSKDKDTGVFHSQKNLAKVAVMIWTSHMAHKSMVHIYPSLHSERSALSYLTTGNKIALLCGDYLIGNSLSTLADFKDQEIVRLMMSNISDLAEGEFLGPRDKQNNSLPSPPGPPGTALEDWTLRNVLSAGSLLGKSCQGALKLGGHGSQFQKQGFRFGKHLALAWQACLDLEPFLPGSQYSVGSPFNLTSAPVLLHLEMDPSLYPETEKGRDSVLNVDYGKIHKIISQGPAIEQTKELRRAHSQKAMEVLQVFQESDARTALSNIIVAMGDL